MNEPKLEKPWPEMTKEERGVYIAARRAWQKERREVATEILGPITAEELDLLHEPMDPNVFVTGGQPEPPVVKEPEDTLAAERAERRKRLLGDVDAETAAMFSDEELEKIDREAKQKAVDERKKAALRDIRAIAELHARTENDLIPKDVLRSEAEQAFLNEKVWFKVLVPLNGSGHQGAAGIRVNGRLFRHGEKYCEPRHVFTSIAANVWKAWFDEIRFSTLNQDKPGNSAIEIMGERVPRLELLPHEIPHAA